MDYSNFITPPDFVEDDFHTVTVVDASPKDVELLGQIAKGTNNAYNVYLYHQGMDDTAWLAKAIEKSDAVIVNTSDPYNNEDLCKNSNVYYYGSKTYITDATKVDTPFDYFAHLEKQPTK